LFLAVLFGSCSNRAPSVSSEATAPAAAIEPDRIRRELEILIRQEFRLTGGMPVAARACDSNIASDDCARWRAFAGALLGISERAPRDRYIQGQVVYSLVRGGAYDVALAVLERCQVAAWWCAALRGFAMAESGRVVDAESAFDQALDLMSGADYCVWTDVSPLLSGEAAAVFDEASCSERRELLPLFWALADPAWSVAGNDRRVEHFNRKAWSALYDDALPDAQWQLPEHHVEVVRRGMDFYRSDARWGQYCPIQWSRVSSRPPYPEDGYAWPKKWPVADWPFVWCRYFPDSRTYRVIPRQKALLDPYHASESDWPIEPNGSLESYVPSWGELIQLDHAQVAFFERGDLLVAAAALDVPDDPMFREAAHRGAFLFLHSGPDTALVTAAGSARDGRWTFFATAPRQRYVVGLEGVVENGIGRMRFGHGLPHDAAASVRTSDILLYTSDGSNAPDSLEAVVSLMRGSDRWSRDEVMGIFLEVYGGDDVADFPVTIDLEQERGVLARLAEFVGIGGANAVNLQWSQPGADGRLVLSFTLPLSELPVGRHTLRVSVSQPGAEPVTIEKSFLIASG
jgi:hypothetical protein